MVVLLWGDFFVGFEEGGEEGAFHSGAPVGVPGTWSSVSTKKRV